LTFKDIIESFMSTQTLIFTLNDQTISIQDVPPTTTLLNYLRQNQACGTKEGCAEGDCGACTVILRNDNGFQAVNACLLLLPMLHGKSVYTVEGIASTQKPKKIDDLHPVQQALVKHSGTQCGYCTPGVVMSLFEACYRKDLKAEWQLDDQLCGNLCRCTGYDGIAKALREIAGQAPNDRFSDQLSKPLWEEHLDVALDYTVGKQHFVRPTTLESLFKAWQKEPQGLLIAGGTDLNLMITKRFQLPEVLIALEGIPELSQVEIFSDRIVIGAHTSLSDLETLAHTHQIYALARMLRFFAARQIKNKGTIGGNLCNASPIGDLPPALLALNAQVILASAQTNESGEIIGVHHRKIPLEDFFLAYRKTALQPLELLQAIEIPRTATVVDDPLYRFFTKSMKVSKRQELDISTVSMGMQIELVRTKISDDFVIQSCRLFFGGMAATPKRAVAVEQALIGKVWQIETIQEAMHKIDEDFAPISDHRASAWYRSQVAKNLLLGFFEEPMPIQTLADRPTATMMV
jgi:xanthine dehydrogenase small subunit